MRSGREDRVHSDADKMVHYLHRHWSDNGDTLCGQRVWFKIRLRRGANAGETVGFLIPADNQAQVTCMECILLQAPP